MRQVFERGEMWLGDCLDLMADIPDGSVDMVLCDLPYGTTQNKWDSIIPLDRLWAHYWRVAKPNAAIVLTAQPPFDKVLGVSCLRHLKYEWIWEKTEATGHLNAKKQPMKAHENVLVFYREQSAYFPIKVPAPLRKVTRRGRDSSNYGAQRSTSYESDERYPRSVIQFVKERGLHPTQKPVALFDYLIRTYTNPGELVLDNCSGSGTTALAAHQTDRRFLCIERDVDYYLASCDRVAAL